MLGLLHIRRIPLGAFLAAAVCAGQGAVAGQVPYFHDFLGGVCVREQDIEAAFLVGGKGLRPPPICIEDPCEHLMTRAYYDREILGRASTDEEWNNYLETHNMVCSGPTPPEALISLIPHDPSIQSTALTSDPIWGGSAPLVIPWIGPRPSIVDNRPSSGVPNTPVTVWPGTPGILGGGSGGGGGSGSSGGFGSAGSSGQTGGGSGGGVSPGQVTPIPLPPAILLLLGGLVALRVTRSLSVD